MTRIENASPLTDRDELKKEIRQEIRGEGRRKKLRSCGGCLVLVLILLGVPAFLLALMAAESGFYTVPLLSRYAYRPTAPTRDVRPFRGETADQVMMTLPLKGSYDESTLHYSLPVTEQELTTLLQGLIAKQPKALPFPVTRLQVAIEPDLVELFAVSPQDGREATVRFRFRLMVAEGALVAKAVDLTVGDLHVPNAVAQSFLDSLGKNMFDSIRAPFDQVGKLIEVQARQGLLTFVIFKQ